MITSLVREIADADPGRVQGLYLYGSAVAGGLRPDSDIDLLLVTERSLDPEERSRLLDFLLRFSGRRATVVPGRPLELTSVMLGDLIPWTYPPVCDFLYGEWLRAEFDRGDLPVPQVDPGLAVLVTTLHQHSRVLRGPHPADLLPSVPADDLRRSLHDSLASLLDDLVGDERNVLLTLARMIVTLESGDIVSKDQAAARILPTLRATDRETLRLAAAAYLGEEVDDWDGNREAASRTASSLAARIRR